MPASTSQRVFTSTFIQLLGRFIVLAAGLASVSLLTRLLGPDGYGAYIAATLFVTFFVALADWGLPAIVARDLSQNPDNTSEIVNTVLVGRLLLSLPMVGLAWLLAALFFPGSEDIRSGIAILSFGLVSNAVLSLFVAYFQAKLELKYATYAEVGSRFVTLALIVLAFVLNWDFRAIILITLVGGIAQVLLLLPPITKRIHLDFQFNPALFMRLIRAALPLGAAIVLNGIYFKVDGFMLSLLRPVADVGIYGAAYKLFELVLLFPVIFGTTVFPVLVRNIPDMAKFRGSVQRSLDFLIIIAVPLCLGGSLVASDLINLIGGTEFMAAVVPLRLLLPAVVFSFVNILMGLTIVALDKQRQMLWLNGSVLLLNIVLNLLTIPRFGYVAAAINTLITEALLSIMNLIMVGRFSGFRPTWRRPGLVIVSGLIMSIALLPIESWPLALKLILGGMVYALAILLLRVVRASEIREIAGWSRNGN